MQENKSLENNNIQYLSTKQSESQQKTDRFENVKGINLKKVNFEF